MQVARTHAELANVDQDLQKYLLLSDLQSRNETLFYAVLMSDPATFMPIVYYADGRRSVSEVRPHFSRGAGCVSADYGARPAA